MRIATLTERREAERQRRLVAISVMTSDMAVYARQKGGRFVLFGSYVTGRFRPESDLDVLVLFPNDHQLDAILFLEGIGYAHRVPLDIIDGRVCREDVIQRIIDVGHLIQ